MSNRGSLHERVERFVNAELPRAENRDLVRLLLGLEGTANAGDPPTAVNAYEHAFSGAARRLDDAARDLEAERREAPRSWAALAVQPRERRLLRVRNEARFATWGLHALLLERSRASAGQDPEAAAHLAELALAVADRLDPRRYGAERVADFRGAALIALGTARRLAGERDAAEQTAAEARETLENGTGDRLEEAELLRLEGALCLDAGAGEEAAGPLGRARALERLLAGEADGDRPAAPTAEILGPLRLDTPFSRSPRESDDERAESGQRA